MRAIKAGFTSVMIDGSLLPYEENKALTRQVAEFAHLLDVSVEGEIGTIGTMGNSDEGGVKDITYTNPNEVVDFVEATGCDALAIAIGTAHGIYPKGYRPKLQLQLLEEIEKTAPVPLVLHGGSDNPVISSRYFSKRYMRFTRKPVILCRRRYLILRFRR